MAVKRTSMERLPEGGMVRRADARAMGMRTLIVDTASANFDMRALYADLGSVEVPPFEQSGTLVSQPEHPPS